MADIPPGTDVLGSPSLPIREAMRGYATLRKLASQPARNKTGQTP